MSGRKLTKREAIQLITAIVDEETDESTQKAFFQFIENHEDVRRQYESEKRIKHIIATRCKYHHAPETLRISIKEIINDELAAEREGKESYYRDYPSSIPRKKHRKSPSRPQTSSNFANWLYAAAATLLVVAAFWGLIFYGQQTGNFYQLEEYVYEHFDTHNGKLIPPTVSTASLAEAEIKLSDSFNLKITVPPLKNAKFKGVVYTDFVPGFKSPLLEYYLPDQDQHIYIFAFNINELKRSKKLIRNKKAVEKCLQPEDFYIHEIKGKHVVSWRWDGTWYAAISNHEGKELASMIEPLNYTPSE